MKITGVSLMMALAASVSGTAVSGDTSTKLRPLEHDNVELRTLFSEDQADRSREARDEDWKALHTRDGLRRDRVLGLLRDGLVRSAADHGHAAMVLQHSAGDIRLAHALATIATTLDPGETRYRWLVAASWDRLLMQHVQPQWYGTQYQSDDKRGWYLYPVAQNAVTDAERTALGVPTLAQALAQADVMAASLAGTRAPAPTIEELQAESDRYQPASHDRLPNASSED